MDSFVQIVNFTHDPIILTEVVHGDQLGRLMRFYEKGGKLPGAELDPVSKKSSHDSNPGKDLSKRMWPTGGDTFTKEGVDWSRSREYRMAKSQGDHRFHSQVHQLRRLERSWLTPTSFSVDIQNCHFSLLRMLLDQLYSASSALDAYPMICKYVSNREWFWDEMKHVGVDRNWKPMFCAMLMCKSPQSWLRDEGFDFDAPYSVSQLYSEVERLLPLIVTHPLGKAFRPMGHTKMSLYEITTKTIYSMLSAYETFQMRYVMQVAKETGHPVTMWIHDGVELLSNGLCEPEEICDYLDGLRPKLTELGFSKYLVLVHKSKCDDLKLMEELIDELEDVEVPIMASELEYETLKKTLESDDYANGGRSLCWIESRKKYLYLVKDREYATAVFSSEFDLISQFKNLPRYADPSNLGKYNSKREWIPGKLTDFIRRWMKDPCRATKSSAKVVFPGNKEFGNPSIYNFFHGFDVERWGKLTEEEAKDPELIDSVKFVWFHLRSLVDTDEHVEWWKNWICHMFQCPDALPRVAGVMHSMNQGAGKNLFESIFRTMLGPDYSVSINNPQEALLGTFNGSMEGKVLVVINESTVNDSSCVDIFTDLITNPLLQVRRMHMDRYSIESHCRFWITTNASNCTPIKSNERRFQVSTSYNSMLDHEYATRLASISTNKRVMRAIYEELMSRPMDANFPFAQTRVASALYLNMQAQSAPIPVRFLIEWVNLHEAPTATAESFIVPSNSSSSVDPQEEMDIRFKGVCVTGTALYNHYTKWATEAGLGNNANSHSRVLESRDQFTAKLVAELQVTRESKDFSPFGAMYFRDFSRKRDCRNTRVWVFQLDTIRKVLSEKFPLI